MASYFLPAKAMQNYFRKFEELVFCDLWFPDSGFRFLIPVSGFRLLGLPCLEEFRHLIKSPMFTKDRALDRLLNLKMVAKDANHPKSGFFEAVFRAFREKTGVTDDQFTKYLEVLLGDKDHEKVLESIARVDKAMRISSPPASRGLQ